MRPILKLAISLLFLLFLTAADFKDYFLILDQKDYIKLANRGDKEILKRSIVFDELIKPSENSHLEANEKLKTEQFAFLLKKKKTDEVEAFINSHDSNLTIHHFYVGFSHFMKGEYEAASLALQKYEGENFIFHKYLLLGDCLYEQKGHLAVDELIVAYQKAMDASKNEIGKEIAKNRIKYIIYKK